MVGRQERTIEVAERIVELLKQNEVQAAVIGAAALAVHLYPRYTEDFDLGINVNPFPKLRRIEEVLTKEGLVVELDFPDADDPLGGVLRVMGDDFERIEVVNFQNPWPGSHDATGLAREALNTADIPLRPGSPLRVVTLPHLVALKLFAGGPKSKADVLVLLEHNREHLNVAELRDVCGRHGLGAALEPVLKELGLQ